MTYIIQSCDSGGWLDLWLEEREPFESAEDARAALLASNLRGEFRIVAVHSRFTLERKPIYEAVITDVPPPAGKRLKINTPKPSAQPQSGTMMKGG